MRLLALTIAAGVLIGAVGWGSDQGPRVVQWSSAIAAVIGWAGDAWRRGRAIGVALLAGALAGEAMLLLSEWHNRTARYVLAAELALGAVLPYLLARPKL